MTPPTPEPPAPWPLSQWSEADLLEYCRRTARLLSFKPYHTRWSIGSDTGFPDLVLCRRADPTRGLPGRLILAELKRAGRPLTTAKLHAGRRLRWTEGQREWLTALLTCPGVETYWWTTADVAEITEILQTGPREDMCCVVRTRALLTDSEAAKGGNDAQAPQVPGHEALGDDVGPAGAGAPQAGAASRTAGSAA